MIQKKYLDFTVVKSDGNQEKFSKDKLLHSLLRSGLPPQQSQEIADNVSHQVVDGFKTKKIYDKTLKLVKRSSYVAGIHYSLKRAIFDLGPSGYYFEMFVAKYFNELGFDTKIGRSLQGRFVTHEVDVVAKKEETLIYTECKFHNHIGIKNDIKVALYVKARWDDLKTGPEGKNLEMFYLATNTTFTLDALTYAKGTGLQLLGVNAPQNDSFLDQIKRMKLYPITSLRKLGKLQKTILLSEGIILAKDLLIQRNRINKLRMSPSEINLLIDEVHLLMKGQS